jgi:hypothetical protein
VALNQKNGRAMNNGGKGPKYEDIHIDQGTTWFPPPYIIYK